MINSVFDIVENIVGKGKIACTSNFSLSQNVFKRPLSQTHQKVSLCGNGLNFSERLKDYKKNDLKMDRLPINNIGLLGFKIKNIQNVKSL